MPETTGPNRPEPIDIPEDHNFGDLTVDQLTDKRNAAVAEANDLMENGDRTVNTRQRHAALVQYANALGQSIVDAEAPVPVLLDITPEPEAEPEPAAAVVEPDVEPDNPLDVAPDTPESIDDTPAPADPTAEPILAGVTPPALPGDLAPAANEVEVITPDSVLQAQTPGSVHQGFPLFAAVVPDGGSSIEVDDEQSYLGARTSYANMAKRGRALLRTASGVASEQTVTLGVIDRLGSPETASPMMASLSNEDRTVLSAVQRLSNDPIRNTAILYNAAAQFGGIEPLMAAMCCLRPQWMNDAADICLDASQPLEGMFGTVAIGNGCISWLPPWGFQSLLDAQGMPAEEFLRTWTVCDQEGVDPADSSTWKGNHLTLPEECEACTVEPYFTTGALRVSVMDELDEDRMRKGMAIVDAMMAVDGQRRMLRFIDSVVSPRTIDLGVTGLGAAKAMAPAMTSTFQRASANRNGAMWGNRTAIVPEHLAWVFALDRHMASEIGDQGMTEAGIAGQISDMFRPMGINNVIVTPDFGAEDAPDLSYLDEAIDSCNGPKCADGSTEPAAPAFASGPAPEPIVNEGRIRIIDPSNYRRGRQEIYPYQIRRSPELMEQNAALMRGEHYETMFKMGDCSRDWFFDVLNACPTGARADLVASPSCESIIGGGDPGGAFSNRSMAQAPGNKSTKSSSKKPAAAPKDA